MSDSLKVDEAAKTAWLTTQGVGNLDSFIVAFRAGYDYCRTEIFEEQRRAKERENDARRRFRQVKKEIGK